MEEQTDEITRAQDVEDIRQGRVAKLPDGWLGGYNC